MYTKLAILALLHYLNLKMNVDKVVDRIYFDTEYHVKRKFASIFIELVTFINLFSFEIVQRCQHFQPCVFRGNSYCF